MLFEELGFYYVGPIDGHNLDHLLPVLRNVRDADVGPVLVHVVTQKGKGYAPAERSADKYHGVIKFNVITGAQASRQAERAELHQGFRAKPDPGGAQGRQDRRHHGGDAVAAPGSICSAREFPERCFDVGIAEQHGVTFAAGLATEGYQAVRGDLFDLPAARL